MPDREKAVSPDWIAVDWGTSSLRVWAMTDGGTVLAKAVSPRGMGSLTPADYESALLELTGKWIDAAKLKVPVIICGMAGARQGWVEAAYRQVPCRPVSGAAMTLVRTTETCLAVSIVPGLCQLMPSDVMRGEETQIAGLLSHIGEGDAVVCLPGTHSKWVTLQAGMVSGFSTFMTGELFALLSSASILRHSVDIAGEDEVVFCNAVQEGLDAPERLTGNLFGIRASDLLNGTNAASGGAHLSGLLIGIELAATRKIWRKAPVHLAGATDLARRYAMALSHAGGSIVWQDSDELTLAGLTLARSLQYGGNAIA